MKNFGRFLEVKTLFAIVLASLLISSLTQRYLGHINSGASVDFFDYYFAARVVRDNPHADLYEGATNGNPQLINPPVGSEQYSHAKALGFDDVGMYLYPPLLADLLAPFSQLSPQVAAACWRVLNLALISATVILLSHMMRVRILSFEFAVFIMAAYTFWPNHEALADGQITIVMLALWAIGIVAYFDGRVLLSAIAFALATAFKVTPILIVPVFLLWKDRKWLISYVAVSLGLVSGMVAVNGWRTVSVYPQVVSAMGGGAPALGNKTISSLVTWAYYERFFSLGDAHTILVSTPHMLSLIGKAASGAFYLLCLFLVWRSRNKLDRASKAATIAVFGMVSACVSPVTWRHGYTLAFIALAIFWVRTLRSRPGRLHLALLALTTFTLGSRQLDLAAQAPLPWICKLVFAAAWIVFTILFCLDALVHVNLDDDSGVAENRNGASTADPFEPEHSAHSALQGAAG